MQKNSELRLGDVGSKSHTDTDVLYTPGQGTRTTCILVSHRESDSDHQNMKVRQF